MFWGRNRPLPRHRGRMSRANAVRLEQRAGGAHRCAGTKPHAWGGRGGETETSAGCKAAQVKVLDPRNPRYNNARSLAVGKFIWLMSTHRTAFSTSFGKDAVSARWSNMRRLIMLDALLQRGDHRRTRIVTSATFCAKEL